MKLASLTSCSSMGLHCKNSPFSLTKPTIEIPLNVEPLSLLSWDSLELLLMLNFVIVDNNNPFNVFVVVSKNAHNFIPFSFHTHILLTFQLYTKHEVRYKHKYL